MRTSSAAFVALLAACADSGAADAAGEGERVACALDGAADFSRECVLERATVNGAPVLVVRHPDGGFRRFETLADGQGLATADGAEAAVVAESGGHLEIAVGADRYRFPARIDDDAGE